MSDKVCFIVPAYNAEKTIGRCLSSIISQRCEKDIIVVDDGSSDTTPKIARGFRGIRLIRQKNAGPAAARNTGLKLAKGKYIAFIDSDVVLPKGWAKKAISLLKEPAIAGVGGPGRSVDKSVVSVALDDLLYGVRGNVGRKEVSSVATMDIMYKSSAIKGMYFDESFPAAAGEDPEFNFRLLKRGKKLLFDSGLSVKHYHPTSMRSLLRKWYHYGTNYPLLCSKHREMRNMGFYARVIYVPVLIVLAILSILRAELLIIAALQIAALFFVYLLIGLKVSRGKALLAFPFIHTLKQLAQLFGTFIALLKR